MNIGGILLLYAGLASYACGSKITFTDGGYDNILVAISADTPRNLAEEIIENIKRMFQDASPVLHIATNGKAYFRSVRILIPESWNQIEADATTWENSKEADVRISEVPDSDNGEIPRPFTRQLGGCGEPGEFIHFTTKYLIHAYDERLTKSFGKPGKVLVHEWAHYRYGVFDEYGSPGDSKYPLFYIQGGTGKIVPNLCLNKAVSYSLIDISTNSTSCNIDPNTSVWDNNCRFILNEQFDPDTSLASVTSLDSISKFCETNQKHRHVYEAKNKHNEMCKAEPVTNVIMRNQDFQGALDVSLNKEITYHIVRKSSETSRNKFILVTDLSYCMQSNDRFEKLQEAAKNWIKYDLPSGSELGIVSFSSYGHINAELTIVTDDSRDLLISKIPQKLLSHKSCIGCGLALGTQLLKEAGYGGVIVLITNTREDGFITIRDVQADIVEAGIRVVTMTFGQGANRDLEKLADQTDGKSFLVQDYETCEAVEDAFIESITLQHSLPSQDLRVKIFEELYRTKDENRVLDGCFDVDFDTGRNLQLKVFFRDNSTNVESIELTGPDDQQMELSFDSINTTAVAVVPMINEGKWYFSVKLTEKQSKPVLVTVSAQMLPDSESPICTRCWIPNGAYIPEAQTKAIKIYAEVMKGSNPVIGASVKAFVEKPDGTVEIVELLDDGTGADCESNDGLYARYFTKATQSGRYSLKCQVIGNQTAYEALGFIGSRSPHSDGDASYAHHHREGTNFGARASLAPFHRVVMGGSFQLESPVEEVDAYPPGRVSDLSAHLIDWSDGMALIHLKWTAPGDELDAGTVARYEIKYSFEATEVLGDNFEKSENNWLLLHDNLRSSFEPVAAGAQQEASILLSNAERGKPYFISLRAFDKAGKVGEVSNLATFFVPNPKKYVLEERTHLISIQESSDNQDISSEPGSRPHKIVIGLAFGIFITLVLVGSLMVFVAFLVRRMSPYQSVQA